LPDLHRIFPSPTRAENDRNKSARPIKFQKLAQRRHAVASTAAAAIYPYMVFRGSQGFFHLFFMIEEKYSRNPHGIKKIFSKAESPGYMLLI
jgi:hypothetical protein